MNDSKPNFGVLLPTREAVISGRSDPSVLFQLAERAEVLGFHSVWVGDSLTARPRVDALTTLAAVGARTRRVRLGTAIFLAALRHPILLAYQLGSLDWITGGRIDLGVGYGRPKEPTQEHEFEILGLAPGARMKMSEELVHVMRRLWREKDVSYAGAFTNFEHVTLEPKPVQPGGAVRPAAGLDVQDAGARVGDRAGRRSGHDLLHLRAVHMLDGRLVHRREAVGGPHLRQLLPRHRVADARPAAGELARPA